jgi:hypothetical protein
MNSNRKYLNRIWIAGQCKVCGNPVIITGESDADYFIYCSNNYCENHQGISVYDDY